MPVFFPTSVFYGWRIVAVCFVAAAFAWGCGVFGASIYLSELTRERGWSVSLVSSAVTVFYLTSALSPAITAALIGRYGPRPVFISGALALSLGTAVVSRVANLWQLAAAFMLLGLGYSLLSLTGITTTLVPWFDRHQGRSVAIALMGASFGALFVVPAQLAAITRFGFPIASLGAGILVAATLIPLAAIVLRFRRPRDLGLVPDGVVSTPAPNADGRPGPEWKRATAVRSMAFWSIALGFALGLAVQVGFFTHQVMLAKPLLGVQGAGWLVSATGFANMAGRLVLARVVDQVAWRPYTAVILVVQAATLGLVALAPTVPVVVGGSLVYGFCLGQITTLSPIAIRREFGAAAFGAIYGVAATVNQFISAFGPSLYGTLHDEFGGYRPVLGVASTAELLATVIIVFGGLLSGDSRQAFVRERSRSRASVRATK